MTYEDLWDLWDVMLPGRKQKRGVAARGIGGGWDRTLPDTEPEPEPEGLKSGFRFRV